MKLLRVLVVLPLIAAAPQDGGPPELPYEGKDSLTAILGRMDLSLVLRTWRAKGVLACTRGFDIKVCLFVENAYPSGLFEVLRQPWRTQLAELKGTMDALRPATLLDGRSASHTPVSADGTALQFAESHVLTFVPDLGLYDTDVPIAVPSTFTFQTSYFSELDPLGWRSTWIDLLTAPEMELLQWKSCGWAPDLMTCAGTWGSYFPRIGFIVHPSLVISSVMQGLRAGRAASRPLGRTVTSVYPYEPRTGHYVQMLTPLTKPATSIGTPLVKPLEMASGSKYGNYLYAHFGIFEYCAGCVPVRLVEARPPAY